MQRRTLDLDPDQRSELRHARDRDPRPYLRERAAALLKISEGTSAHRVALSGLNRRRKPDSLYEWLER